MTKIVSIGSMLVISCIFNTIILAGDTAALKQAGLDNLSLDGIRKVAFLYDDFSIIEEQPTIASEETDWRMATRVKGDYSEKREKIGIVKGLKEGDKALHLFGKTQIKYPSTIIEPQNGEISFWLRLDFPCEEYALEKRKELCNPVFFTIQSGGRKIVLYGMPSGNLISIIGYDEKGEKLFVQHTKVAELSQHRWLKVSWEWSNAEMLVKINDIVLNKFKWHGLMGTQPYPDAKFDVVVGNGKADIGVSSFCIANLLIRKGSKDSPIPLVKHYQPRTTFTPLPAVQLDPDEYCLNQSQSDVRNTLRMRVFYYSSISRDAAENKVAQFKKDGFNAILSDKQRYLFRDTFSDHNPADGIFSSLPYLDNVRYTKILSQVCHEQGLKFYLHLTCCASPDNVTSKHPEWYWINLKTGKPEKKVWGVYWTCINNDDFLKAYYQRLDNLIQESQPDGLMVDEVNFAKSDVCGCSWCQKKFKKDTGYDLLQDVVSRLGDLSSPVYQAFVNWRVQKTVEINKEIKRILRTHRPDGTVLTYYACPSYEKSLTEHSFSYDVVSEWGDIIGYEVESGMVGVKRDFFNRYWWPIEIANAKSMRAVNERKEGNIYFINNNVDCGTIFFSWLLMLSQGGHQYSHDTFGSEYLDSFKRPLIQWETKYQNYLAGLRSAANIAVFCSPRNDNFLSNPSGFINRGESFFAICNTLTFAHIPYKVILDKDLQSLPNSIKTIIMMNIGILSDADAENIRSFVRNGGTLIASAETSLYDERGVKRSNFALADIFGCSYDRNIADRNVLVLGEKLSPYKLTGEIEHPDDFCAVHVNGSAEVAAYMRLINGNTFPGLTINTYGKGRVIYFAGHPESSIFFTGYTKNKIMPNKIWRDMRDSNMINLFCSMVRSTGEKTMDVENLPLGVVAEIYRHEYKGAKGLQVHLANLSGGMITDGQIPEDKSISSFPDIQKLLPDQRNSIQIKVYGENIKNAYILSPDFDGLYEVPIEKGNNEATCRLPTFERYLIIYFNQGETNALHNLAKIPVCTGQPTIKPIAKYEPPLEGFFDPASTIVFMDNSLVSGGYVWPNVFNEYVRCIYGQGSEFNLITVPIQLSNITGREKLEVGGVDDEAKSKTAIKITVNGKTIFSGKNDFSDNGHGVCIFTVPKGVLNTGKNVIQIENIEPGQLKRPPWLAIAFVKIIQDNH